MISRVVLVLGLLGSSAFAAQEIGQDQAVRLQSARQTFQFNVRCSLAERPTCSYDAGSRQPVECRYGCDCAAEQQDIEKQLRSQLPHITNISYGFDGLQTGSIPRNDSNCTQSLSQSVTVQYTIEQ